MRRLISRPIPESLAYNKQVVILIDVNDLKVEYANPGLESYCGVSQKKAYCYFHDLIHPEDRKAYFAHLNHFKNAEDALTREIKIRLKSKEGSWNMFHFKDRRYKAHLNDKKDLVISIAERADFNSRKDHLKYALMENLSSPGNEYLEFLELMDEGYCIIELIFDKAGKPIDYLFIETNSAFEKQVNLQNAAGKTMKEFAPQFEEHWFEAYGEVAKSGRATRFQHHAESLDNSWFDVYAFKTGDVLSRRVVVFFRNITKEKQAEQILKKNHEELKEKIKLRQNELEESKELLQSVFDSTDLGIGVFEVVYNKDKQVEDLIFLRINRMLKKMYRDLDPVGKKYSVVSRFGTKLGVFDDLKKVASTGKPLDKEVYFDKEKYNTWFRVTAKLHGELLIASVEDITKKKIEAQKLKESLRFKRQLVRASPESILIVNLNSFSVRYLNRDIFPEGGITRERVEGMSLEEILPYIHPRDREKIIGLHKQLLKASIDDIVDIEIRLKLDGVVWEWFSVRGKIFHRKNKSWVDEYVLLVRNITKLKNTQDALLKAEKLSIQGEIARTFAHELRNPLASIGMAADVLEKKFNIAESNTGAKKYLDILKRSSHTLNKLIGHLLNSSNYSPSRLKAEDLGEIIEEALNRASDRIYLSGVQVKKNFSDSYPIMADKEKLCIALLNILVNASEAVKPDEGIIEIEIKEGRSDFILSIRDNGHGIDKAQKEKLFDAFYTNKDEGVGIGLTSVKNILDEHDAEIKVWSELNKGTCFKMFFTKAEKN